MNYPMSFRTLDVLRGTATLRWYKSIRAMETSTLQEMQSLQLEHLRRILKFVSEQVPFYIELFRRERISVQDFRDLRCMSVLPIITKRMLRTTPDLFRPIQPPPRKVIARQTSGATSEPFPYLVDAEAYAFTRAYRLRSWEKAGYILGERYFTVSGSALIGDRTRSSALRLYDLLERREHYLIERVNEQTCCDILRRVACTKPRYLFGYPSVVYELAKRVSRCGPDLDCIKGVIVTSECLTQNLRDAIEDGFGAPVWDFYGCGDGTVVACECDRHDGMHYGMQGCILETVDEAGNTCKSSQAGRLIATSLLNYSMPFIRYETSDVASLLGGCSCGNAAIRICNILGRMRDRILCSDGSWIHGASINKIVSEHKWIARFQVVQKGDRSITMRIERRAEPRADEQRALLGILQELTRGLPISLDLSGGFLYTTSGKFLSIMSEAIE